MSDEVFVLVQDDDGHWYVIPADKEGEFFDYVDAVSSDSPAAYEVPEPEWLTEVGGAPSLVKFRVWWID